MIYCGYQGCGKSTFCRAFPDTTVDLDSSAFTKVDGWEQNYVELAEQLSATKKDVFISAHRVVIEYCLARSIPITILAPSQNKETWRSRLEFRYYKNPTTPNFKALADFEQNYEKDMAFYVELEAQGVPVRWIEATIITNIREKISGGG